MEFLCTEVAQVITAHTSVGADQLHLEVGQLILILGKNASGWWVGELQVRVGGGACQGTVCLILCHEK